MSRFLIVAVLMLATLASVTHAATATGAATVSAGNPSAYNCSLLSGCSNCTLGGCGYCAFEGALQGTGACFSWDSSNNISSCVDPKGTLLGYSGQCAAKTATCSQNYDCGSCGQASLQLNCGWCVTTGTCSAGTGAGPNSNNCPAADWGFQSNSCGAAAQCATANNNGCASCKQQGAKCGYCSTTGRCELGNSTGPTDKDCSKSAWFAPNTVCPVVDHCTSYSSCGSCENAYSGYNCGWCGSQNSGSCKSGNANGPSASSCYSTWSFQSCPIDATCASYSGCSSCNLNSQCLWCNDGAGSCMAGSYSPTHGTCSSVVPYTSVCSSSGGGSAGWSTDSYPLAGTLAIVFLASFMILGLIRACIYLCGRCGAPRPSFDSQSGNARNYASGGLLVTPLFLAVVSLVFKVASLGLNHWDQASASQSGVNIQVWWGVLSNKVVVGSQSVTETYNDLCSAYQTIADMPQSTDQDRNNAALCETQMAAGAITLVLGIGAVTITAVFVMLALVTLIFPARLPRQALLQWRFAGLAATATLSTVLAWGCSAHMVVHHQVGQARLGPSWILMLVSFILDTILVAFTAKVVRSMPASATAPLVYGQAYAVLAPGVGPVGAAGGSYPLVQNQYAAPQPQQVQQLPVGYGQPMQPGQQPQYAPPPQQPYSQVPYGVPYGQQQQQQQRPPAYAPQRQQQQYPPQNGGF